MGTKSPMAHNRAETARRIRGLLDQAAASLIEAVRLMREGPEGETYADTYANYGRGEDPRVMEDAVKNIREASENADEVVWYALK